MALMPSSTETIHSPTPSPRPPLRINPYLHLGLRSNPFQVIDDPALLRRVVTPELAVLADELVVGAAPLIEVIGESGWGKSTLLTLIRAAGERLTQRRWTWSYVELNQTRITFPSPAPHGWIIDEAQRLNGSVLRRIVCGSQQSQPRIVLGTHDSFTTLAQRLHVPIRSIQLTAPTSADLQAMLIQRVSAFAIDDVRLTLSEEAAQMAEQFATGNRRLFEELMHEVFYGFARDGQLPETISAEMIQAGIATHTWS